jgi:hypothetical protein
MLIYPHSYYINIALMASPNFETTITVPDCFCEWLLGWLLLIVWKSRWNVLPQLLMISLQCLKRHWRNANC